MAKKRSDLIDITIKIGDHPAVTFTDCVLHDFQMNHRSQTFIDWTRADSKPEEVPLPTECRMIFDYCGNCEVKESQCSAHLLMYVEALMVRQHKEVFIEIRNGEVNIGLICTPSPPDNQDVCYIREHSGNRYLMNWGDYGKKWRVWDMKPTDKERKEAEWSD